MEAGSELDILAKYLVMGYDILWKSAKVTNKGDAKGAGAIPLEFTEND
jgi:hypothetical protein